MDHEFQFFSDDEGLEDAFPDSGEDRALIVRLDKWLWAARFFKTRAVARMAVEKGRVFYNGESPKPSREIEIGATLTIHQGNFEKTVIVRGLSTRRRSTEESLQLFEETEDSRLAREQNLAMQPAFTYPPRARNDSGNAYGHPGNDQLERRPVRFLRRSFNRAETTARPYHRPIEVETFD